MAGELGVLVARLAVSKTHRAPLRNVGDLFFLGMADELQRQGVGRKVAADLLGMSLRAYQKRLQRVSVGARTTTPTLHQEVAAFLKGRGAISREEIATRFSRNDERVLASVLRDMVELGVMEMTTRGGAYRYRLVAPDEPAGEGLRVESEAAIDVEEMQLWAKLDEGSEPPVEAHDSTLRALKERGLVEGETPQRLEIPAGSEGSWEAAVWDHFATVARALAEKASDVPRTTEQIGGMTLSFDLHAEHPLYHDVVTLLDRTRQTSQALWRRIADGNESAPIAPENRIKVRFYAGQHVSREPRSKG